MIAEYILGLTVEEFRNPRIGWIILNTYSLRLYKTKFIQWLRTKEVTIEELLTCKVLAFRRIAIQLQSKGKRCVTR